MSASARHTLGRWLFVVLVATTLATQARVPALGLGFAEISGMGLLVLEARHIAQRISVRVLVTMSIMILGFVVGYANNLLLGHSVFTNARDLFAMVYAMLASLAAASHLSREKQPVVTAALALSAGLLVQLVPLGLSALGMDGAYWLGEEDEPGLPFVSRYTGFSTNPNQLGVMVCSYPFVALHAWQQSHRRAIRWMLVLGVLACVAIATLIQSNTVFASYMATGAVVLILGWNTPRNGRIRPSRVVLSGVAMVAVIAVFLVYADASIEKTGDRDANGRFNRWVVAMEGIAQSALLGVGPGGQSGELRPFDGTEAHNTLLDVGLQGGVLSVLAYAVLLWMIWRATRTTRSPLLLGMLLSTLIQQTTHYTLRHPITWLYLLLPVVVALQVQWTDRRRTAQPVLDHSTTGQSVNISVNAR